jgi:hypothetical protein
MSTRLLGWGWFVVVQLIMLVATLVGAVLVLPLACWLKAWTRTGPYYGTMFSIKNLRVISRWSWGPLNYVYGNPEDGVSGEQALVWNKEGTQQVVYNPRGTAWKAYCWNLRNSANQLTYTFGWKNGPYYNGRRFHAGWKDYYGRSRVVFGRNT